MHTFSLAVDDPVLGDIHDLAARVGGEAQALLYQAGVDEQAVG